MEMLSVWLQCGPTNPWKKLATTLENMGKKVLAQRVLQLGKCNTILPQKVKGTMSCVKKSSDQLREKEQEIQLQRQQMLGLQNRITATNEQLLTLQKQLSTKDEQLVGRDRQLWQKEAAIAAHQQEIQELRQQLQSSVQVNDA